MKLIFLHGLGQNAQAWDRVIQALPDYDCLAVDLFENGRLPENQTILEDKVRRVLATELEDCVLVGLSLGATLAFCTLNQPPVNLKGIIACAGQYRLKGNLAYYLQKIIFRLMPKTVFRKQGFEKVNLFTFYASMSNFDIKEVLLSSNLPALTVCGLKDKINLKTSQEAANLIPKGRFVSIPNAGHLLTDDAPEILAKVVKDFVSKLV